ncbi:hypothetical protein HAX54_031878, partial [Datura stramonium]|nr:hypothetical protein [Datura stramonium]
MAPTHHSHRNTGTGVDGPISAQQSRQSLAVNVVSFGELEVTFSSAPLSPPASCEQVVHSSDNGSSNHSNSSLISWPTLPKSTKAPPKSPSYDSLKILLDGSVCVSQGTGCHQLLIRIIVIRMVDSLEDLDCIHMVQIQIGEAISVHNPVEIEIRIRNPTEIGEYTTAESSSEAIDEHGWVPVMLIVGFNK